MTENWSNDAENADLPNTDVNFFLTFILKSHNKRCIFNQINAALVHNKEVLQNIYKSQLLQTLDWLCCKLLFFYISAKI